MNDNRDTGLKAADRAIHGALNALIAAGYEPQDLASIMMSYSVHIFRELHGDKAVSIHLARMSGQVFAELGDVA